MGLQEDLNEYERERELFLSTFPHCNAIVAKYLLSHYKSLHNLFQQAEDEDRFMLVHGNTLGKQTVGGILKTLRFNIHTTIKKRKLGFSKRTLQPSVKELLCKSKRQTVLCWDS